MASARRDQFDIDALRVDPTDPAYVPRGGAAKTRKKKWQRKFVRFSWVWLDRLKSTARGATYRVALLLVYEHWRTGGRAIELTNIAAAEVGVPPDAKGRALEDLERAGLIKVKRRPKRSPLVTVLTNPQ